MGTKPQSSGLLSKVANIFRASEAREGGASGREGAESRHSVVDDSEKNALQALIQRKRQDDLVRRREFNYLRKLRKLPHSAGKPSNDSSERISAFAPSSGFSVDDRASTIKKIDAIEAHMISTWARTKVALVTPPESRGAPPGQAPAFSYASTEPALLSTEIPQRTSAPVADDASASDEFDDMELDFTGLLSTPGAAAVDTWDVPVLGSEQAASQPTEPAPLRRAPPPVLQEIAATDLLHMPTQATLKTPVVNAPPEPLPEHIESALHDAAIQFAEGDVAAAEAVLLGLMQGVGISPATADVLASALFDLYRATGQQDGFDVVAMDYAERFGRSPGEWFSLPERLQSHAAITDTPAANPAPSQGQDNFWEAPKLLTGAAVAALRSRFADVHADWYVDWSALNEIRAEAAQPLGDLMAYWCTTAIHLHWSGIDSLLLAVERKTLADDNTVDPVWWRLRMDALCILHRHDDFESLALDYCVVYEVSPPSWRAAACHFVRGESPSEFGGLADNPPSVFGDDLPLLSGPYASFELLGEILGESQDTLDRLAAVGESADHVVVSCALAVRLDFPAAGALLNWVIDRQAHGCQVQFVQVPRLVAVFFQMLGIDRYAQILVRAN